MGQIDFSQFTLNNQGITDLKKVLFSTAFKMNPLFDTCTAKTGVINTEKLGFIDGMGAIGAAGRGCNPTYTNIDIKGQEKQWDLKDWSVAKKICYDDLKNTIAQYGLRTGTDAENVIGTEFWNVIMIPLLDRAFQEMYYRLAWFGDTAAKNIASGGVITDGVDTGLVKATDGLWKRINAIIAANPNQKTAIAANAESTYATQKSALAASGVATGIIDALLADADPRIAYASDAQIMMTRSLFEALRKDYRAQYHDTIPFYEVSEGVKLPSYEGVQIRVVSEWDNMIKEFEDSTTALNNPHRAVFCSPSNLFVGTSDTDVIADLSTTFDDVTRNNHIYAASNLGTLVGEDNLLQVAI